MSDCKCNHMCILCMDKKRAQSSCPCRECLIKAICQTKCMEWLTHWARARTKPKFKKYERGERYV